MREYKDYYEEDYYDDDRKRDNYSWDDDWKKDKDGFDHKKHKKPYKVCYEYVKKRRCYYYKDYRKKDRCDY